MSTPVFHYFNLGSLGRGEVNRLFLHELNIKYEDKLYDYGTWSEEKKTQKVNPTGKLPLLEIDGERLSGHLAICRYLSRKVGGYDGETNFEKYLVDTLADVYSDWRAEWVTNLTEKSDKYKNETVPHFYGLFTEYYSRDTSGPYLLGQRPTYADFAIYQVIDNDAATGTGPAKLSAPLAQLKEAMEARPNIKEYIAKRGQK